MAVYSGEERDKSVHWSNCMNFGVWAYGGQVAGIWSVNIWWPVHAAIVYGVLVLFCYSVLALQSLQMAVYAGEECDKSVHWPNFMSFRVWAYG